MICNNFQLAHKRERRVTLFVTTYHWATWMSLRNTCSLCRGILMRACELTLTRRAS